MRFCAIEFHLFRQGNIWLSSTKGLVVGGMLGERIERWKQMFKILDDLLSNPYTVVTVLSLFLSIMIAYDHHKGRK